MHLSLNYHYYLLAARVNTYVATAILADGLLKLTGEKDLSFDIEPDQVLRSTGENGVLRTKSESVLCCS